MRSKSIALFLSLGLVATATACSVPDVGGEEGGGEEGGTPDTSLPAEESGGEDGGATDTAEPLEAGGEEGGEG